MNWDLFWWSKARWGRGRINCLLCCCLQANGGTWHDSRGVAQINDKTRLGWRRDRNRDQRWLWGRKDIGCRIAAVPQWAVQDWTEASTWREGGVWDAGGDGRGGRRGMEDSWECREILQAHLGVSLVSGGRHVWNVCVPPRGKRVRCLCPDKRWDEGQQHSFNYPKLCLVGPFWIPAERNSIWTAAQTNKQMPC